MGLHEGSRLLAFVVASTSGGDETGSSLPSTRQQHQDESGIADEDLKSLILELLSLQLPSHSVPDTVVLVPALCLTNHGEC